MGREKIDDIIRWNFFGGQDVNIVPLFDVHLGAPECREMEFIACVDEISKMPDTYVVIGGDMINNGVKNSKSSTYEETIPPHIQKREMANILYKIRDRILCAVSGNHERRSNREVNDLPLYDICAKLDIEHLYREYTAYLHICLGIEKNESGVRAAGRDRPSYTAIVNHGVGGGMTGAAVNRTERYHHNADLLITGHTHSPFDSYPTYTDLDPRLDNVYTVDQVNVKAKAWMKYGGYASGGMMRAGSNIRQMITLRGSEKKIHLGVDV